MVAAVQENAKKQADDSLVDLVYFGWNKSVRILGRVHYFIKKLRHKAGKCQSYCMFCRITSLPMTSCENMAELYIFRNGTWQIKKEQSPADLKRFREENGIL